MSDASDNMALMREWLRGCDALESTNFFRIDYLPDSGTEYALYAVPSALKTHENILGLEVVDDIQTENYIFAAKEPYGSDIRQNLDNLAFFQAVVTWIIEQNTEQNFPSRTDGTVKSVLPTLTPYMAAAETTAARYQIQIKVTYRRSD